MQKSFEVTGPVELEVRLAAGEVVIDPTLHGRIEVELEGYDDESRRMVEEARIELRDGGGRSRVLVDVEQRRGAFGLSFSFGRRGISCRIRCPIDTAVSARTKSAGVAIRGRVDSLNVVTASGDVDARDVTGGVNVRTASGDVRVGDVGSGVNIQTASGDVQLGAIHGPLNVATASGDVAVEAASDNVNANTVSGDQRHDAVVSGQVSANSVSGDILIGVRRGSDVYLDCNTLSGDTTSELEVGGDPPAGDAPLVEIRAKSVSGDIRIVRAPAPTDQTAQEVHT
jgi:hypothetical protein